MINNGPGFVFALFPFMITIVFVIIIGIFIFALVKGIGTWNNNNHQPVLSVEAKIVSKRTDVSGGHHMNDNSISHTHTSYYVTFEVESGDRMELQVRGDQFGMLAEEDIGKLKFQGTRYHDFQRSNI